MDKLRGELYVRHQHARVRGGGLSDGGGRIMNIAIQMNLLINYILILRGDVEIRWLQPPYSAASCN